MCTLGACKVELISFGYFLGGNDGDHNKEIQPTVKCITAKPILRSVCSWVAWRGFSTWDLSVTNSTASWSSTALTVEHNLFGLWRRQAIKLTPGDSTGERETYRATLWLCIHWLCLGRIHQRGGASILSRVVWRLSEEEMQRARQVEKGGYIQAWGCCWSFQWDISLSQQFLINGRDNI